MIPIKALSKLLEALPKCYITEPIHKNKATGNIEPNMVSWIKDKNGELVGSIHWQRGEITIFHEYEYSDEVRQAIGEKRFIEAQRHFDSDEETENPIIFEDENPTLTDYGKLLYENQRTS